MWILQSTGLSHVSVVKVLETDIGSSKIRVGLGEGKRSSQEEKWVMASGILDLVSGKL